MNPVAWAAARPWADLFRPPLLSLTRMAQRHRRAAPVAWKTVLKQSESAGWTVDSRGQTPLAEVCHRARQIGLVAIDLLYPDEWQVAQDVGLTVSMTYPSRNNPSGFIPTGFNTVANHPALLKDLEEVIPLAAKAKVPNVIAMFGNRVAGMEEAEAIDNCIAGLSKIAPLAAQNGVTVCPSNFSTAK